MGEPARKIISEATVIEEISKLVTDLTGVQLGTKQATMVRSRLCKRMIDLKIQDLVAYWEFFLAHSSTEADCLVSLLTTHHTYFFREYTQYEYLIQTLLPKLVASLKANGQKHLNVWSAACSTGQEVYTLAMLFSTHLKQIDPTITFEILATDVDTESVKTARNGVYRWQEVKEIPAHYMSGNWIRGTAEISEYAKVKPQLKEKCRFETANLFEIPASIRNRKFDLIFCKNVFIYFNAEQIQTVVRSFINQLGNDAYLLVGLAESLFGQPLPIVACGPSIYAKPRADTPVPKVVPKPIALVLPKPVRVICVDDSPTILALLQKLLTRDAGFEVVATAANGLEATEKLRTVACDVMTLDIHMPEQGGIRYLETNFGPNHPPVVMLSSVSREDSALGLKCLEIGASDFIEKPTLANLTSKSDEIRTKIRAASSMRGSAKPKLELENEFKRDREITTPETKRRVIFAGPGDFNNLVWMIRNYRRVYSSQPPTLVFIDAPDTLLPALANGLQGVLIETTPESLEIDQVYVTHIRNAHVVLPDTCRAGKVSVVVFGGFQLDVSTHVLEINKFQLIIEDLGEHTPQGGLTSAQTSLRKLPHESLPSTSFAYCSNDYLAKDER